MKSLSLVFVPLLAVILLGSCSSDEKPFAPLDETTSRFIKSNDKVILFGKLSPKGILTKTGYHKKGELIKQTIESELVKIEGALNINSPIYFAVEGPIRQDGSPESMYFFMEAKSDTALMNQMERERGNDIELKGEMSYVEDGDFCLGVKDRLVIAVVKGGDYNAEKVLLKAFKNVEGEKSGGKVDQILKATGDFVIGTDLEALYATSDTDLEELSKAKKSEIAAMVADSYLQASVNFKNGEASLITKNLFSKKLMNQMFFKTDKSTNLIDKIDKGSGTALAGLAINVDTEKMESFLNKYSPELMDMLFTSSGFGKNPTGGLPFMSMITNGQAAALLSADEESFTMNANFYINSNELGKQIGKDMISSQYEGISFQSDNDGIRGSLSFGSGKSDMSSKIELPGVCSNFGKTGLSFFMYFEDIDVEEFGTHEVFQYMTDLNYIIFEVDNNGSKLIVKSKNDNENILETALNVAISELMSGFGSI